MILPLAILNRFHWHTVSPPAAHNEAMRNLTWHVTRVCTCSQGLDEWSSEHESVAPAVRESDTALNKSFGLTVPPVLPLGRPAPSTEPALLSTEAAASAFLPRSRGLRGHFEVQLVTMPCHELSHSFATRRRPAGHPGGAIALP